MNRRELIRGAAVVAVASALPTAAGFNEKSLRWYEVHDYLLALMKNHYGVDNICDAGFLQRLVEYNFNNPEIE